MSLAAVQFAVLPSFSHLAFSDEATIAEALYHVLQLRNRQDPEQQVAKQIAEQTGATTVGDLRRFTDKDFRELKIPAICRVYLKHMVRQSMRKESGGDKTFMDELQDDFNFGQPFDMSLYQNHLAMLAAMGFKQDEAMEALVITENKGIEGALEILFNPDTNFRKERRAEAVQRLNRRVPALPAPVQGSGNKVDNNDIAYLRRSLEQERQRRQKLEYETKTERAANRLKFYKEYLSGVIADESIGPTAFEQLLKYRKEKIISDVEHLQVLSEMHYTAAEFEGMKKFSKREKRDTECVICLDKEKDFVVSPCMHVALCETCVTGFTPSAKNKPKCPICSKDVQQTFRIYM